MDKGKTKAGKSNERIFKSATTSIDMNWQDKISTNLDIMGGKPVIKGTRVPVQVIVGSMAGGMTLEEVCQEYNIKPEHVKAALAYAEVTRCIATKIEEGEPLKHFKRALRVLKEFHYSY